MTEFLTLSPGRPFSPCDQCSARMVVVIGFSVAEGVGMLEFCLHHAHHVIGQMISKGTRILVISTDEMYASVIRGWHPGLAPALPEEQAA